MGQGEGSPGVEITEASLLVKRNGEMVGEILPYREFFIRQQLPMTIPDVYRTFTTELYVIVAGWEPGGESATFKAFINPLINWLWFGGFIFVIGTMVAAWPSPKPSRRTVATRPGGNVVTVK